MDIQVDVKYTYLFPYKEINKYVDLVVYGVARATLDYTASEQAFPYLSGNLEQSAMAQGVVQESDGTYYLGAEGADYAAYVWNMPQETTNWTNPKTLSKWYVTIFNNKKELIVSQATANALRSMR